MRRCSVFKHNVCLLVLARRLCSNSFAWTWLLPFAGFIPKREAHALLYPFLFTFFVRLSSMAPSTPMKKTMKAMAATPMKKAGGASLSKGGLAEAVAAATGHKKAEVSKVLDALAAIGTKEVKSHGVFTVPGPPPATCCCLRVDTKLVCCKLLRCAEVRCTDVRGLESHGALLEC